jgi:ribosomal protein L24
MGEMSRKGIRFRRGDVVVLLDGPEAGQLGWIVDVSYPAGRRWPTVEVELASGGSVIMTAHPDKLKKVPVKDLRKLLWKRER